MRDLFPLKITIQNEEVFKLRMALSTQKYISLKAYVEITNKDFFTFHSCRNSKPMFLSIIYVFVFKKC